jgi:23S rRNA pseudouridine955/2504/2580 synthase/23S rRNA pseudouridine1911/1915/1917 synthase
MKKNKPFDIIFEDDDCLAINKAAGILSVPDRFDQDIPNIKHLVREINENYLIVHRLDKDTSGVLLIAKHPDSQRALQQQFENSTIEKEYVAIIRGIPNTKEGSIASSIVPHDLIPGKMKIYKKGKTSETHWILEEEYAQHGFMRLKPKTGRTHQLRLHLSHMGHPIVADPLYGNGQPLYLSNIKRNMNRSTTKVERPLISRTALHAEKISFDSLNGERITVTCPLPKDMRAAINQLRKNS